MSWWGKFSETDWQIYRNWPFTGNPLIKQLGEKAGILHDGISRQEQSPNRSTSADIPVFKKRTRASKNNYGWFNIFPILSKLFERLFSKQIVEFFKRIFAIEISM